MSGDRVACHLHNSVELVIAIFAVLKAGAVFVVINRTTKEDKLAYILNNCRAAALLADDRAHAEGLVVNLLSAVPSLKATVICGANGAP